MQNILVIEDQPDICLLVQTALEENDAFRVSCASTGNDALPQLDVAPPDLVILDILMPGMHGLEFAAHACARGVPLVLMTGEPTMATMLRKLACPYLEKPFGLEQLSAAVRAAIDEVDENTRTIRAALDRLLASADASPELLQRVQAIMEQTQG